MPITIKKKGQPPEVLMPKEGLRAKAGEEKLGRNRKYTSRPFKRLVALGRKRLRIIEGMLLNGELPKEVATFIRTEWGEYTDVTLMSCTKQIERYRDYLLKNKVTTGKGSVTPVDGEDKPPVPEAFSAILDQLDTRVDAIKAMNELIQIQRGRILAVVAKEQKVGLPFNWLTKDLTVLGQMIRQYLDMEFDLGMRYRVPKEIGVHASASGSMPVSDDFRQDQEQRLLAGTVSDVLREVMSIVEEENESGAIDAEYDREEDNSPVGEELHPGSYS